MSRAATQTDADYVQGLFPELAELQSDELRRKTIEIWVECWHESTWERIEDAPKNPANLPPERNLVDHVRAVTVEALESARIVREIHGIVADTDVLIASGLLHDVSKLVEYQQVDGAQGVSPKGGLIQHAAYGAHKAWEKGISDEIVHIILSHTEASKKAPRTLEGAIIHYVDYLDTDALLFDAGASMHVGKSR